MAVKAAPGAKKTLLPWIFDGAIEDHIVFAVQAIAAGNANGDQQRIAFEFITRDLCGTDKMSFWPGEDGARATDFAEGKRFVGNSLKRIANLKAMTLQAHGETPEEDAREAEGDNAAA